MKNAEEFKVTPINTDLLTINLEKKIGIGFNQEFHIDKFALVSDIAETDNECVYSLLVEKYHHDKVQTVVSVPVRIKTKKKGGSSIGMVPDFYVDLSMNEIKPYMLEQISLKEFMKGRYRYNPRIEQNEREFLKDFTDDHKL
jgi:hypothetical protein